MCVHFDSLTKKNNILLILAILLEVYLVCFHLLQYTNKHRHSYTYITQKLQKHSLHIKNFA